MEQWVVVSVLGDGHVVVRTTRDLDDQLWRWAKRDGDFLPVAAFRAVPRSLRLVVGCERERFPLRLELTDAARWFRHAPVETGAQFAVMRHLRRLDTGAAVRLLRLWEAALRNGGSASLAG